MGPVYQDELAGPRHSRVSPAARTNRQNTCVTAHAHLTPLIVAIVIGAGALHATWNAIAKQVDDRLMAFAWIGIASTVVRRAWRSW